MTVSSTSPFAAVNATGSAAAAAAAASSNSTVGTGIGSMGASDFLKLLTTQMQQQDPTAPMDNNDMLAQMAQFTSLSNTSEMNSTLKAIAVKIGAIDATTTDTSTSSTSGVSA